MAERKTVLLRVRPQLYEALRRWAVDEFRSVNGQIEFLLHKALHEAGRMPPVRASGSEGDEEPDDGEEGEGAGGSAEH